MAVHHGGTMDVRKDYLISIIGSFYGRDGGDLDELRHNEDLISFLDDPTSTVLIARQSSPTHSSNIMLDNRPIFEDEDERLILFYKRNNESITPENLYKNVGALTMSDSGTVTLFDVLQKAFIPSLSKTQKAGGGDAKVLDSISKLEQSLHTEIQTHQSLHAGRPKGVITSIAEEKGVWSTAPTYAKNANEKEIASWIFNLVDTIDKELKSVADWSSGTQIFGPILNCLDDIWKMGEKYYPESRMIHLLDIVGNEITILVQTALKSVNLWETPFNDLEKHLLWGMTMCEKYIDVCHNLTTMLWPSDASRKFNRGEYSPSISAKYAERLRDVLRIRSVHKQLVSLVSLAESDVLHPKRCFAPFSGINPIFYNAYTEPLWKHAVEKFEKLIVPAETSISSKLLSKLNVDANALQLLAEYKRYKELIMRPKVSNAIIANREQFLVKLINVTTKLREEFSDKSAVRLRNNTVTTAVSNIYYGRKALYRVRDIEKLAKDVLGDLSGHDNLQSQISPLIVEIENFENQCYSTWVNQMAAGITNKELNLNKSDPVIEFSDGRLMEVTYNPKLVTLIDEAQQLTTLSFRVPREIQDTVVESKKFLKQAKELDQIANFHNTIGDRMIPSQRPMMLDTAVALSKLVQSQNGIAWEDSDDVEKYISSLKNLVSVLGNQNNALCQRHIQVKNKVKGLFDVDLVRQQQKWKNIMVDIRQIFIDVADQGFRNIKSWESHWDRQLYKVLEVKYLQGMVKVNESLPEIHLELVYRQQKLQFKPPLEEARMKYYTNLKRFLQIPKLFRGVTDANPDELIFGIIVERNCHRFEKMYKEAEQCISKVAATKHRFEDWVALGSADVDTLSKECLVTWEDWEKNFKVSKSKGQEISRLPTADEKIGCFIVSFAVLRFEIELLNRKYWEVLVTLLQNSIFQETATAEAFLNDSVEKLRVQPQTVEEIAAANALEEEISKKIPEIHNLLESIDKKNKTLATWAKERTDLSRIKGLWENFLSLFENHKFIIGRQVETVKANLEKQIVAINEEVEAFKIRWDQFKPKDGEIDSGAVKMDDVLSFIHQKREEWNILLEKRKKTIESSNNLGLEDAGLEIAEEIENDLKRFETTWMKLEEFKSSLKEFEDEDWIVFRTRPQKFEEFLLEWETSFRNQERHEVNIRILQDVESYKSIIPNLRFIRGDSFTEKHWYELYNIMGIPSKPLGLLKAKDILSKRHDIEKNLKQIQELNARAAGEITVRQALNELDAWEIDAKFDLAETLDSHGKPVHVIQDFKSILNKVGDNQSLLQSIRTSPFYTHFADRISVWEVRLADLDEYIQNLNKVQRRWVYLEPIFSQGVLEAEQQRFRRINEDYKSIMDSVHTDSRVVVLCKIQGIRNRLNMLVDQLHRCQNSLNEFLETKRSGFPRFYFLGDDDLLEILGQSTKPNVIQSHLKKLFAGIYNVEFDKNNSFITAIKSVEQERVPLKNDVRITPNVEVWLRDLANEMQCTLKSYLLECISESKNSMMSLEKYPAQTLCLCNSIKFSERCEEAIRSNKLSNLHQDLKQELENFTNMAFDNSDVEGHVSELKRKDLIVDIIHKLDIVEFLIKEGAKSVNEWSWQKQLRAYLREDGCAIIKMADSEFPYAYEYQGNAPKLVHTPLTDKCYLTLTQGMRMGLGGNPYGPAGTGKTESVKALGGLLGRQVLVFNCDEGIDVKAMGRIFIGLVKCGAWGCFDEVNRLEGATLSAVSMQIQPIQNALKSGAPTVKLLDETVTIDSNTGIFVTLNPAGKGYGGRNNLPDNLKQLFRPVVMSQPDNDVIAEVILFTEGFQNAKKIGRKLVEIFKLASRLLTSQNHYDWGLRALKTVLKGCGSALKEFKTQNSEISEENESDVVVGSLRLNTLPKLTYSDCFRFDNLVKDVFPNAKFQGLGHQDLADSVKEVCREMKLTVNDNQVRKCLELFEQLQQRMGVVIVGPSCSGKSTVITLLKQALVKRGQRIKTHLINPKSIPRTQLLGQINMDTRQWTDGILTLKAQEVYAEPPEVTSWIICDGEIDPEWVESLNSVLDDNRLLTLPSGWRIKFGSNVNFIFETHDLTYASPATVSRMGMILMSEDDVDINGIVNSWLENFGDRKDRIAPLIESYFHKGVKWISSQADCLMHLPLVSVVQNALSHMREVDSVPHMAVAMINGFTGHLSKNAATEFANQVLTWTGLGIPREWDLLKLMYNRQSDSIDVYQDEELEMDDFAGVDSPPLVMTTDAKQLLSLARTWLKHSDSFMIAGFEGCGKSMILQHAFASMHSADVATIYCSSLVKPQHVLLKLTQYCRTVSTNFGRVYKPKDRERLILYFKDLNLVKPDKWGTCQLVEFLQQLIKNQGFYDSNLEWVTIENIQIVVSINYGVSSAKYLLSPRFTSIVRVGFLSDLEKPQLQTICKSYMKYFAKMRLQTHSMGKSQTEIDKLSASTIQFYESIKAMFKSSTKNHYRFTPRDLTTWIVGLLRYDFESDQDPSAIITSWAYETCRMFRDKLVTQKEKDSFDSALTTLVAEIWHVEGISAKVGGLYYISDPGSPIVGGTSRNMYGSSLVKTTPEDMLNVTQRGITLYSREYRNLNIVIFPEVLQNVANVDRALSAKHGSLLLAGKSGVGRRTAVSIVTALHNALPLTLKVGRGYGVKNFKQDLKQAIQSSAVEGNKVYLVIEDFQLVDVTFLDMLNSLISSGEVPGLYTPEEFDGIVSSLREAASLEGFSSSLTNYFVGRVRQLLRVILVMDFTNDDFVKNCESNPAVYKECNFLWLDSWSASSLATVPSLIIKKFYKINADLDSGFLKTAKAAVGEVYAKGFIMVYESLTERMSSPRKYVSLVHNYAKIFNQRTSIISTQLTRLSAGISKLSEAKEIVEKLKIDASEQEVLLAKKQAEANKALELITETMRNANIQRGEVQQLREQTAKENEMLEVKKKSIDAELADIEPEVKKAQASVGSIKNEAISEIRSLRAPPEVIRDILEAVLRLMGIMDMSWNSMKLFLSQRGVKEEIRNFDARKIKKKDRNAVEKLLKERPDSFSEAAAKRASAAAAPLATWVKANVKYSRALEKIEPLENQQKLIQQGLMAAEGQLGQLSSELMDVDQRVERLKANLNQFTKEAAETEIRLGNVKATLLAAEGLVGKLQNEFARWTKQLQDYGIGLKKLPYESLMASAFMTYLSETPEDVRQHFVNIWSNALKLKDFNLLEVLSNEQELRTWKSAGLPSDRLSLENGLIIHQLTKDEQGTLMRPYVVDPSSRAGEWLISSMTAKSDQPVVTISLEDVKFPHELELSVRFGKTLIVTEADTMEPILVPILRGDIVSQGSREIVQIGDKFVDVSPSFRIFLVTRNPAPKINPDTASLITIVNFTTTRAGLSSQVIRNTLETFPLDESVLDKLIKNTQIWDFQLLTKIIEIEKPELKSKNEELINNVEEMKQALQEMSEQLLHQLANASGNILENKELLSSLNSTKENSMRIEKSLSEQSVLEASLNQEINVYLPLSEFGSKLYFSLLSLSKLNKAYQFSLRSFVELFVKVLKSPDKSGSTESRISLLKQDVESTVFDYVCRCLFKDDRVSFALNLAHELHSAMFNENEWEAFTGLLVTDANMEALENFKSVKPRWISEEMSPAVYTIKSTFPRFYETLNFADENLWNEFMQSNECENALPQSIKDSCSQFQIVMLIQTLRPDRLHTAMTNFIRHFLGRKFVFAPPLNLGQVFKQTSAEEPVLLLIRSGADPSQELRDLAYQVVGEDKYVEISMGQGQMETAIGKLVEASETGKWICFKNLHLVVSWLDSLEKALKKLRPNENFRLWLTSEAHDEFPAVLAQNCLKIAYEAPQGLKKNLQRTYSNWSEEYVTGERNIQRIQSLLVLAIFHAVVQERRTFIPQGWNKFYEFNESDIRAGADVIDQVFRKTGSKEVQWQYVRGIFENAIYGGRVDNVYDLRVLVSYLDAYFNDIVITGSGASRKSICSGLMVPSTAKAKDYLAVINGMPDYDKPAAFGLPENIERSWQRVTSSKIISQVKILCRAFTGASGYDRAIWQKEMSPLLNLWKKLVQGSIVAQVLQTKTAAPSKLEQSSDAILEFVQLEYQSAINLLKHIHGHLGAISKVVRGSTAPSPAVFEIGNSLLKRQTPEIWLKKWEGPFESTQYLQGVVRRAVNIIEYNKITNGAGFLNSPIDLSNLFNPDAFLVAFKQQCARKLGVCTDELKFRTIWDSMDRLDSNVMTCKLTGLLLEGCNFDGTNLRENKPESPPIMKIMDCTVGWVPEDSNASRGKASVSVPLYYNETREKLLGSLDLPASADQNKWIQAGVALFLTT